MSITVNGTAPAGGVPVTVIQANKQAVPPGGILKLKFSAPAGDASYALTFAIGPPGDPFNATNSYVVQVSGGQEQLAVVDAGVFSENVLVVGQATNNDQPFAVTIE
jgi:hypothetical protein